MEYGNSTFPKGLFPFALQGVRRRFSIGGARAIVHLSVYTGFISARAVGAPMRLQVYTPILGSGRFGHEPISMSTPSPGCPPFGTSGCAYKGSQVTFSMKMFFYGEGSKGHLKTHLGASNSTRYSSYGLIKFQFSMESTWKCQPNNALFQL